MTSRANNDPREGNEATRRSVAGQLALLDDLRHAEIRAASAQVASVIGHMIGTPLNVIVGRAALLRASPNPESMADHARRIEEQAQRLAERFQRLIHYLTVLDPEFEARSARAITEDALALYGPIAEEHGVRLVVEGQVPDVPVTSTPALMVLGSVLSYALRSTGPDQTVRLSATSRKGDVVFDIWVPGMPAIEGRLDRLDPPDKYDSSSAEREQVLATCAVIARRYQGRLELDSDTERKGSTIRIHWSTPHGG